MNRTKNIVKLFKSELETRPQVRTKTKFLWLPKTIAGKTKWLTDATWEEKLMEEIDHEAMYSGSEYILTWIWKPVKWIEK